jgi:4'-phosphopantetheinyl transferase
MQDLAVRRFELAGRSVELWPVRLDASDVVFARFRRILAPDEAARAARFRFDHLRRSFILSRGALRILLGNYLSVAPGGIRFCYGSKGKPALADPVPIQFNASHSGALALFAFTLGCEVGVDVEQIRRLQDMQEIASRFFCSEETAELMSLPSDERERAFFFCWTRKEAYVKAVGEGLSIPLDGFRVTLRPNEPARFIHLAHDTSATEAWTLHSVDPAPHYAAALAYRDLPRPVRMLSAVEPVELLDIA